MRWVKGLCVNHARMPSCATVRVLCEGVNLVLDCQGNLNKLPQSFSGHPSLSQAVKQHWQRCERKVDIHRVYFPLFGKKWRVLVNLLLYPCEIRLSLYKGPELSLDMCEVLSHTENVDHLGVRYVCLCVSFTIMHSNQLRRNVNNINKAAGLYETYIFLLGASHTTPLT